MMARRQASILGATNALSVTNQAGPVRTAFVLAGGGSFGAIQVGMMHSLAAHGISADMVVGSSVGALNGAYYAGDPTLKGILQLETIWRGLHRRDVFPLTWRTLLGFIRRRDFLIPHDGIEKLIDDHLPYRNLQDAKLPVHIVATDMVTGDSVVMSEGSSKKTFSKIKRRLSKVSTKKLGFGDERTSAVPIRSQKHEPAEGYAGRNRPRRYLVYTTSDF
jgi:predicted acylesterase/phospholipase RssA